MIRLAPDVAPPPPLLRVAFVLVLLGTFGTIEPDTVHGQAFGRIEETESTVSYFYHTRPGEATVQISLWGSVPTPGIYEVPDTTDLNKLLTMAGGIPAIGKRTERRDPAEVTVRVYRSNRESRTKIFESRLRDMLKGAPNTPSLQDDDIVVVETEEQRKLFGWRDVLSVLSTLGSLTLLFLRVFTRV